MTDEVRLGTLSPEQFDNYMDFRRVEIEKLTRRASLDMAVTAYVHGRKMFSEEPTKTPSQLISDAKSFERYIEGSDDAKGEDA